jgi:uncharacterized protein (TIGR00299 family) protein
MGAAGDMLMGALLELLPEKNAFLTKMNSLGLENIHVNAKTVCKCGISGTHITVTVGNCTEDSDAEISEHAHEHSHTKMHDIESILNGLRVSESIRKNALEIYRRLAQAESHVHGCPVEDIHFHEVGKMDAIADILGVCILVEELAPDRVIVSPINVGSGSVRCSHGIMPVPAPATAHLLHNIPMYSGSIKGELCTPTGAVLLAHFADSFGSMPEMLVRKVGYGIGKKDFETANCVRVFFGEDVSENVPNETVAELCCNVDDMTAEALGFACQEIMSAGAKDVFTTPVLMKKGRSGTLITCICSEKESDRFASLMLKHTTTFGVRKAILSRYVLERNITTYPMPLGQVRVKTGEGYGVKKMKLEYEDVAAIAEKHGISIKEAERIIWAHLNNEAEGRQ